MNKTTLTYAKGTKKIRGILNEIDEIIIPDGVTFIDEYAFLFCSSLTKINIPNSVTEIGKGAFFCASSLESIYIDKEKDSLDLSKTRIPKNCKVYWRGEF